MHKVLIESEDSFLCLGLKYILERILKEKVSISQTSNYLNRDGEIFDFYFFTVTSADGSICHPHLLSIPVENQIFLIVKDRMYTDCFYDNKCLEGCNILDDGMSIQEVEKILENSIHVRRKKIQCRECSKPCLTTKEIIILGLYLSGSGVIGSSSILNLSEKTIYAHLLRIKRKLGVSGKKEFNFVMSKFKKIL